MAKLWQRPVMEQGIVGCAECRAATASRMCRTAEGFMPDALAGPDIGYVAGKPVR
jgi:hypothetical protein